MSVNSRLVGLCASLALLATVHGRAEGSEQGNQANGEKSFLRGALQENQMMIQAGELAGRKATHPAVRKLGRSLAEDHRRSQNKLQSLAEDANVSARKEVRGQYQQDLSRLQDAEGNDFDGAFLRLVSRVHRRDLITLQKQLDNLPEDSELGDFIEKELLTVHKHLQMAQAASRQRALASNDTGGNRGFARSDRDARTGAPKDLREDQGEFLGMPTSNNDGTILGWFPAPSRTVEAGSTRSYIAEELRDGEIDPGVENVWQADQDPVGAPATTQRERRASAFIPDVRLPSTVQEALREEGVNPQNARIRRISVFEADSNGEKVYITAKGAVLKPSRD